MKLGLRSLPVRGRPYQVIEHPESVSTSAEGINVLKQIVGTWNDVEGITRGFLLQNGRLTTVLYPGAVYTTANKINIFGQIAGTWSGGSGSLHGLRPDETRVRGHRISGLHVHHRPGHQQPGP